ncbi:centromere protein W-like isoform X2 [Cyprinus carpio]|uniref:Centromere protein W n=2 Tax=Cyprininae TaxID=2743694 RepID=A0A673GS35_9TELE|nr:PREDICTED: centromere protein W isoform X1 [Sinocyclocheilus rhinocerous]XP_018974758.1 centromere protein W-like isoform X2 [Cyprinus carpio]
MSKKAPRAALKLHMKKNTNIRIGKNADLMAQLNLLVVLHRLAEESRVKAFEEKSATIKVHHVRAVAKSSGADWFSMAASENRNC